MKQLKMLFAIILVVSLLFGCSEKEDKSVSEDKKEDVEKKEEKKEQKAEEKEEELANLSEEELATLFFEKAAEDDLKVIYENAYKGQRESIEAGIQDLQQEMENIGATMGIEEVIGKVTLEEYDLLLMVSKLLDEEGNVLTYGTAQIGLMNVDGDRQYVWDFKLLPEHIAQQESALVDQMNNLIENDQQVKERLQWFDEQNRIHQEAFNQHMQAHQQAVDQHQADHQQAVDQHQQAVDQHNQQQNQQMMTPPPAPGF